MVMSKTLYVLRFYSQSFLSIFLILVGLVPVYISPCHFLSSIKFPVLVLTSIRSLIEILIICPGCSKQYMCARLCGKMALTFNQRRSVSCTSPAVQSLAHAGGSSRFQSTAANNSRRSCGTFNLNTLLCMLELHKT